MNHCWRPHHQSPVNAAASQVRGVLSQIHRPEPLHHPVVGPLRDLCRCDVVLERDGRAPTLPLTNLPTCRLRLPERYLVRGPASETAGFVGVQAEDLNGPLNAEVMENTAHLQRQQVLLGNRHRRKRVTSHAERFGKSWVRMFSSPRSCSAASARQHEPRQSDSCTAGGRCRPAILKKTTALFNKRPEDVVVVVL